MEKDRDLVIAQAYNRIVKPWTSLGIEPPLIAVNQIAREANIANAANVTNELASRGIIFSASGGGRKRLSLRDINGEPINNLTDAAIDAAPYKRAVKRANYRSRAPGGGPVVKRRINEDSLRRNLLQLGKGRLKVGAENYDEDEERKRTRRDIKRRLETRWVGKSSVETDSATLQTEGILLLIKKLSERKGVANEEEMRERLRKNITSGIPQIILAIWGPPYEAQGYQDVFNTESPEERMATSILGVVEQLSVGIETRLVILYADRYGTDINGIPLDQVEQYGRQIEARFRRKADFICWSELIEENRSEYDDTGNRFPEQMFEPITEEINRAMIMQRKIGNSVTEDQARVLAMIYRRERIIEGEILQKGFLWRGNTYDDIIKLGTAPSRVNDDPYEQNLPRFYVSGMPRGAWNSLR